MRRFVRGLMAGVLGVMILACVAAQFRAIHFRAGDECVHLSPAYVGWVHMHGMMSPVGWEVQRRDVTTVDSYLLPEREVAQGYWFGSLPWVWVIGVWGLGTAAVWGWTKKRTATAFPVEVGAGRGDGG